jgi:hypothetical protein
MSTLRPGRPAQADTATPAPAGHRRLRDAAARRGIPLATILTTVALVVLTYLAGKLAYRIRDVLLMIAVAGFACLILNPLVVALQRRGSGVAAGPWPSWPSGRWWCSPACWPRSAIRWPTA